MKKREQPPTPSPDYTEYAPPAERLASKDGGQKLRRVRERLNLRFRDVQEASVRIANRHQNEEFEVALSRLSDIENHGTLPNIYKLYSLCVIYRLDLHEVLEWYGVDFSSQITDAAVIEIERTHPVSLSALDRAEVQLPVALDPGFDMRRTTYLNRMIQQWGKLPLALLNGLDLKNHRYALIGTDDWSMYPLLQPGSLVQVDETRRRIVNSGWSNEFERPIYFLEHRGGYACSWCHVTENQLVLQPHPASMCTPEFFAYPQDVEVIGQVSGIAMRLDPGRKRRPRT